jgi:hypothetical protein
MRIPSTATTHYQVRCRSDSILCLGAMTVFCCSYDEHFWGGLTAQFQSMDNNLVSIIAPEAGSEAAGMDPDADIYPANSMPKAIHGPSRTSQIAETVCGVSRILTISLFPRGFPFARRAAAFFPRIFVRQIAYFTYVTFAPKSSPFRLLPLLSRINFTVI